MCVTPVDFDHNMSEIMGDMDDVIKVLLLKLMESLEDKYEDYLRLIRSWFRMKDNRPQFEVEIKNFLTPEQHHLHSQLLIRLLYKSADVQQIPSEPPKPKREHRNIHRFQEGFEPIDPTFYVVTERQEVNGEVPPFMVHERLLPDQSSTLARLMYSAWELGLEGSQPNVAEFLTIATQHFLKNIITAVITRKKGYKCSQNGFIHSLGTAMPNPWLRNVNKYRSEPFHSLKFDGRLNGMNGILKPAERPTREDLEHDAIFRLSASSAEEETGPISLYDLIITLQLYPSLVASNFVRITNTERIYARDRKSVV